MVCCTPWRALARALGGTQGSHTCCALVTVGYVYLYTYLSSNCASLTDCRTCRNLFAEFAHWASGCWLLLVW